MIGTATVANDEDDYSIKGSVKVLNDLIQTSKNLPSASSELGSIQLSLNEVRKRARDLRGDKDKQHAKDHTKAHYLLAGSGLAMEDVDSSLKKLKTEQFVEQPAMGNQAAFAESTLDAYLKIKKDESVLASIEQLLAGAAKDFDEFVSQNLTLDWEQRKEEVKENFGIIAQRKANAGHTATTATTLFNSKIPAWGSKAFRILNDNNESRLNVNENGFVRSKFENYAKVIYRFNNARQARTYTFPLINEFMTVVQDPTDFSKNLALLESWKILQNLNNSTDVCHTSKVYLQNQFLNYVDTLYQQNLNEGLPTNINKIKSFINYMLGNSDNTWKVSNLVVVNGTPIWALIFYLLRAGLYQEAMEVTVNNKASFKKVEHSFPSYLKAYTSSADRKLPTNLSNRLHTEYNQHIKSSLDGDPFRLAVYKVIGRCDLTRKNIPAVTMSIEDWLWMHFMLINNDNTDRDLSFERYSLEDFQDVVISYGKTRFGKHYLQVLVLTGLYELAVQYLNTISEIDAVHLAITLADKKLINVSQNTSDQRKLNFAKILATYISSFKKSDPKIAAEYLILIGLINTPEQIEVCHEAIRELVLETKEFTILLGKVNRDGTRIPGVIEERQPLLYLQDEQDFLHTITEQAARRADEDGRVYDSLLLYQLSEEYDIVISIINGLLGDLLSNTDLEQQLFTLDDNSETNPMLLAQRLIKVYLENLEISNKIYAKNKDTCLLLLKIAEARETFLAKQWQNTLSQIEELDIIPLTDEVSARRKAQDFGLLNKNIAKNIPNLLIMSMTCVSKLVHTLLSSSYQSVSKEQQIESLKIVSRTCMVYAGLIQYKMPREVYSTLINLEVTL